MKNFLNKNISYFGKTNHRGIKKLFGIKQQDRLFHQYIIGKTGTGKTTFLETLIKQDIMCNRAFALFDVHQDLVKKIYSLIPKEKRKDVIYIDTTDSNCKYGYNPLKKLSEDKKVLIASGLLEIFEKLFGKKSWGSKLEHILRNCLLTLLDQERATLKDISKLLLDKDFRLSCIENIKNEEIKKFWQDEYNKYNPVSRLNIISPILNKVGAFLSNPITKQFITEPKVDISLRKIIEEKKILLINLAKGKVGQDTSNLLGALLLHSLSLAFFSRVDLEPQNRHNFIVYCDEFQNFTTESVADMLSELRKYGCGLVLANQYLAQLNQSILEAVLGNVGTIVCFRLGVKGAEHFAKEFYPVFRFEDIVNLPNYHIYLKLMVDGKISKSFSACTVVI